jgi:hypothetical protein
MNINSGVIKMSKSVKGRDQPIVFGPGHKPREQTDLSMEEIILYMVDLYPMDEREIINHMTSNGFSLVDVTVTLTELRHANFIIEKDGIFKLNRKKR